MSTPLSSVAGKAAVQLTTWYALQDAFKLLCANFDNILQRIPAISKLSNYKGMLEPEQLQQQVLAQTVASLDNVVRRLHEKLAEMEEVVKAQEKLCVAAWSTLRAPAPLTSYIQPQPLAQPSISQLIEALEDVWYMCRDELCLKAAALARLHPAVSQQEAASLITILSGNCHEKPQSASLQLIKNWAAMY